MKVSYTAAKAWYHFVPIVNLFSKYIGSDETDFELATYDFTM